MEKPWQKRRRISQERDRERAEQASQADKEALQAAKDALQAVNDTTSTVRNLFFTFLLLGVYIGIIIASTTDKQLLLVSPVKLPLLDVQLPILGFYQFVPWLFLLVHFYFLLQLFLLTDKLRVFTRTVAELPDQESHLLRTRLVDFPLVQMLADQQHDRFIRWVLALMVWIAVLILPLMLLLWAQIGFLPYHDESITWGQRSAVLLDAVLLLLFWPRLLSGQGAFRWWLRCLALWRRGLPKGQRITGLSLGMVILLTLSFSLLVATVPEETWEKPLLAHLPTS